MLNLHSWLRRSCAPAATRRSRRLTVLPLEDRVTPVGELLHTLPRPSGGALFGSSVAASVQYVVSGAPGLTTVPGSVGVYDANAGALLWTLTNPSASNGDQFGASVAVAGKYVVVGAPGDDTSGTNTGRAYVFDATTGNLVSTLVNPNPSPGQSPPDDFGVAVAISGSTVWVGADEDSQQDGRVFQFDLTTGAYTGKLDPPAAGLGRHFGEALSASGNLLAVAAPLAGPNFEGQVYVYNPSNSLSTVQTTIDEPGTQAAQDWFGQSVALDGVTLAVGAPLRDIGGNTDVGEAYVYHVPLAGGAATLQQTLSNPHADNSQERFGLGVGISNNAVIVGSPYDDTNSQFNGQAYIFDATTGAELANAANPVTATNAQFGWSEAAAGDKLVVGAEGSGEAYTFQGLTGTPPVAQDDSFHVSEDASATSLDVLANDTSQTPATLFVLSVTQPSHGTVAIAPDGMSVRYTPAANYSGSDSFTYTAQDSGGTSGSATVTITVDPVNHPPTAVNDYATVPENAGPTAIDVLANDSDPDNDPLTITLVTQPAHGAAVITGGGTGLTYQPVAGYVGADGFTYTISDGHGGTSTATVSITVVAPPPNSPPTAVVDTATMVEDSGTLSIDVLANDSTAPDTGETLTVQSVTQPAHGVAAVAADGLSVTYTPDADFAGMDTFYYVVSDGRGGLASAPVVMTVTEDAADRLEVVTSPGAVDFLEKRDTSLPLDAGVRIGPAAGGLITKAVVKFSAGYVKGRDVLSFAAQSGIKGSFSATTGTLTLTGKVIPATYQAALRTVQYVNRSFDPVSGPRTVSITLYDAAGAGQPGYRQVHVTAVDDKPAVTLPQTAVAAKVGNPTAVLAGIKITDVDSAFLAGSTVTIGNAQAGDTLAAVTTGTGITATFSGGVLTLTGSASLATYVKVLKSITFTASGGVGIVRGLSVTVDDGQLTSDPVSRAVTVG
jgi:hypothetical protein